MIKTILIIMTICFFAASCGKKGDPIYNEENQNTKILYNNVSRS